MRLPLGVKMTLASTLLVALLVVFLGYVHALRVRDLHDVRAAELKSAFTEMATTRARSSAAVLAIALREALEGTELGPMDSVVRRLVATDAQVVDVRVAGADGLILADSRRPIDPGQLQRLEVGDDEPLFSAIAHEVWEDGRHVLRVRQPIFPPGVGSDPAEPRGVLVVGYDLTPLDDSLARVEAARGQGMRAALRFTMLLGALALALGALASLLTAYRFATPIRRLAATAAQIGGGDLAARVAVRTSDEVGALGAQFNRMAGQLQAFMEQAVSRAELERELELAREIQSVLVPAPGPHPAPGVEVAGYYVPASTCGGDFWDFAPLPRGRSALLIGDVTGHGVPAAMLTATAKACVDALRHVHGENLRVSETMRVLDNVIRDAGHGSFFMTAAAVVLDTQQDTLFFTSAGHPPGLLLRWTESGIKLVRLVARGNRLGDAPGSVFEAHRIRVQVGDLFFWYTDGLTDAIGEGGRPFGMRRLLRVLSKVGEREEPVAVVDRMVHALDAFRAGAPLDDDVTFVAGRIC